MFHIDGSISEDCLFLDVYAPENSRNLPVFVWIHGGGYGQGGAPSYDPSSLINTNDKEFVAVIIQYRLGAFGFLSSNEVRDKGALNAGLLDQQMTLQWVQRYISLFGGDPARVTVAGESAGAGSVLNLAIAYGGAQGNQLWSNVGCSEYYNEDSCLHPCQAITASPSISNYFDYNSPEVVDQYHEFVRLAGCGGNQSATFECLQAASTTSLTSANEQIAASALLGIFDWRPVVDGDLIPQRPSQALKGRTNGQRILTGVSFLTKLCKSRADTSHQNNANEGYIFTPQNITTQTHLVQYLRTYFPRLTDNDITRILGVYSTPNIPDSRNATRFQTAGDHGPTAVNQSELAIGHQHVANAFYGELTYMCPSYWLASAFDNNGGDAFQYQVRQPLFPFPSQTNSPSSPSRPPSTATTSSTTSPAPASPSAPPCRKPSKPRTAASSQPTRRRPAGRATRPRAR